MPKTRSIRAYMKPIASQRARSRILKGFRQRVREHTKEDNPSLTVTNNQRREWLHDAMFTVENELESKAGGKPDDTTVQQINQSRNHLLDDMGWNETPASQPVAKTTDEADKSDAREHQAA